MADNSKIEWTSATWNPITGCSIASPGCIHCYAMTLAGGRLRHHPSRKGLTEPSKNGPIWNGTVRFNEGWLDEPLKWKQPRMIFVCAHGDLFHENVPDEWIDKIVAVMALTPRHVFQVLTKRADRMRAYFSDPAWYGRAAVQVDEVKPSTLWNGNAYEAKRSLSHHEPLRNVWLGTSAERQQEAEERIPHLLATPAAVRFISAEPLIKPIDLTGLQHGFAITTNALTGNSTGNDNPPYARSGARLDWVIVGGESGRNARPMEPAWASDLRAQCAETGVAFFMKQLSKANTKDYKKFEAFPADLQVRQFPTEARPK